MKQEGIIEEQIKAACKAMLNEDYLGLCLQILEDYLTEIPEGMKRGKPEFWAASIIWSAGSVNFLSDRSFPPFATLSDVCSFFNCNTSTIGNKAGKIRKALKMDHFNTDYLIEDSPIVSMVENLYMDESGFILPIDGQKEVQFHFSPLIEGESEHHSVIVEEFILEGHTNKPVKRSNILQYEFLLAEMVKKWMGKDGRDRKIDMEVANAQDFYFLVQCTESEFLELRAWMANHRILEVPGL